MSNKSFKIQFHKMQQQQLYKILLYFSSDPQKFYKQMRQYLIKQFQDYPQKQYFDTNNETHLYYFVTRFLVSVLMSFSKNRMLAMHPDQQYQMGVDQLGFVLSLFRKDDLQKINKQTDGNIQSFLKSVQCQSMSQQVKNLFQQVYGKQFFEVDQKRKVDLRIEHGGTQPVDCTMGLDISTSVIGISIFQGINNKLIFLDAVLLSKLRKKFQVTDLVGKLRIFAQYFQGLLKQKNIKITKLYIEEQRKMFGNMTTANTLNILRKFNGMVSGYLLNQLGEVQDFQYINVRSRRKIVLGKRLSKQQSYQKFKEIYKDQVGAEYIQTSPSDSNMDKSDAYIIGRAGLIKKQCGGAIERKAKRKRNIKRTKNKTR